MIALRRIVIDDDQIVRSELVCNGCDYNLKTQPLHGACPECGVAVTESVLYPAQPSGVRRLFARVIDLLVFLTIWYFCTIVCLLFISGVIMTVDYYVPFAAVMRERYPTTAMTVFLLLPTFFIARKVSAGLSTR